MTDYEAKGLRFFEREVLSKLDTIILNQGETHAMTVLEELKAENAQIAADVTSLIAETQALVQKVSELSSMPTGEQIAEVKAEAAAIDAKLKAELNPPSETETPSETPPAESPVPAETPAETPPAEGTTAP